MNPAHLDRVDLHALAQRVPTPFYVYSAGAIRRRIGVLKSALDGLDALICFAVPAEVLVDGGRYTIVRRRQTYEDLMAGEQFPENWQTT